MDTSPVIELLQRQNISFTVHRFEYESGGGTKRSSTILGISEHFVVKSLLFETDERSPILVLMHGDRLVDTKELAKQLGVSKIWSCAPAVAQSFSGWPVGATNPFILKTKMPIYVEETVMKLARVYINGGGQGLLVALSPIDIERLLSPRLVRCAKEKAVIVSKAP